MLSVFCQVLRVFFSFLSLAPACGRASPPCGAVCPCTHAVRAVAEPASPSRPRFFLVKKACSLRGFAVLLLSVASIGGHRNGLPKNLPQSPNFLARNVALLKQLALGKPSHAQPLNKVWSATACPHSAEGSGRFAIARRKVADLYSSKLVGERE